MKAAGLFKIGDIRVVETEKPSIGPGEILMKVEAATTCGSDLKMFLREYPGLRLPLIPWGHESAGIVEEVGEGVNSFEVGDRITSHNTAPCGYCFYCKKELYELCENLTQRWGAYAEYARIPGRIVKMATFEIPDHMTYAEASLIEPFACTVHGAEEANIQLGDKITIIGCGFQGLSFIQLARLYGASTIIAVDLDDYRLGLAKKLGADIISNPSRENVEGIVNKVTSGRKCDVVIEAAGMPETWEQAIDLVRKGGTVIEYGGCKPGTHITVDTRRLHYDALAIKGVFHTNPKHVQLAWDLMVNRKIDLSLMITKEMKLDNICQAYEELKSNRRNIKIAIIP
ncbi:MAG: zinc-binding dehydrogenase [Clostridium sp.]|nr:zinc-binding dehydrogenase [Clostridium sp.]